MKINLFALLTILTITSILFTACRNEEINMKEDFVQGFVADDSKLLTDILKKTYELQELKNFFGQIPSNEKIAYGISNNEPDLTIKNVNEKFSIECLRRKGYSVYKVSEGGYFYVFWAKSFKLFQTQNQIKIPMMLLRILQRILCR